jgi:peptidoglycan/xylan/chitin deacetylase (PgdA/CDA1 family)
MRGTHSDARDSGRLVANASSAILEAYRVPYGVVPAEDEVRSFRIEAAGTGRVLAWPRLGVADAPIRRFQLAGVFTIGPLLTDSDARAGAPAGPWQAEDEVTAEDGSVLAHVHRNEAQSILLPFDPDACAETLLTERYVAGSHGRSLVDFARWAYYRVRPVLPRALQLSLRRRFRAVQERADFPAWPAESALDDLHRLVLGLLGRITGADVPHIGPWPDGRAWALVLTHDVEHAAGYEFVRHVVQLEERLGYRSAWFFVPERDYRVDAELLDELRADGFEVGLHGLRHDGRDMESATFRRRLPAMRRYAKEWGAVGFRAPATHRSWELMPELGLDYDTSYSDVARYEPQAGGCCSIQPFFIDGLVELPITMPMDHTIFEILGEEDESRWLEKAQWLRERGGMALLLTHPDYLREPMRLRAYERFLELMATDPSCWRALPSEVCAWWRARAATKVTPAGDGWAAEGPAAGRAAIAYASPAATGPDRAAVLDE